jgi:hypothetical protein
MVGPLNTYEFWQQQGILNDLKMMIIERLSKTPITSDLPSRPNQRTRGFSFFKKKMPPTSGSSFTKTVFNPELESDIRVGVDLEGICLRTESNFGLYETITRPVVVVRVLVKC